MTFQDSAIPQIHIEIPDPQRRSDVLAAIEACCVKHGFVTGDGTADKEAIAKIVEVKDNAITLKLYSGEGSKLFSGDPLLDTTLHLFDISKPHTEANLRELNERNAVHGVKVERSTSLDEEFKAMAMKAEAHIRQIALKPPAGGSAREVIAGHHKTAVGEWHGQESARLTIAAELPEMGRTKGALWMEGIPVGRQGDVAAFLQSAPDAPLPPLVRLSLEAHAGKEKEGYYSAISLLRDAKKHHVPVLLFDDDATLLVNYSMVMEESKRHPDNPLPLENPARYTGVKRSNPLDYRLLLMNEAASARVEQTEKDYPGKIVLSVGASHALPENGIPGLGDYMSDAAQLAIYDVDKGKAPHSEIVPAGPVPQDPEHPFPYDIVRGAHRRITRDPNELKRQAAEMHPPEAAMPPAPDELKKKTSSPISLNSAHVPLPGNGNDNAPPKLAAAIAALQRNGLLVELRADQGVHDRTTVEVPAVFSGMRASRGPVGHA